jgi:peptidoglycan/xylan/chitin deacetylase (PgdA/CDA1 family)
MKTAIRQVAKSIVIRLGGLNLYHRLMSRETLTVLMFHRVLPEEKIRQLEPDPAYTVSTTQMKAFIEQLAKRYNFVSMRDVLASRAHKKPLPSYALLVTFDDGWNDNYEYGQPTLAAAKVPWTVFVATNATSHGAEWWQETLLSAIRSGRATYDCLWQLAEPERPEAPCKSANEPTLDLLLRYGGLSERRRNEILARFAPSNRSKETEPDMADLSTLRKLHEAGVDIGVHGASHLPLTGVEDPLGEIHEAQQFLTNAVSPDAARTMSFPHGRYNQDVVNAARSAGLSLMFTSDPLINACPGGWLETDLLGRIPISGAIVSSETRVLDPARWMPWLYLRGRGTLPNDAL